METDCVYLLPASFCTYGSVLITRLIHKSVVAIHSPLCGWKIKVQHLSSLLVLFAFNWPAWDRSWDVFIALCLPLQPLLLSVIT